MNQFSRNFLLWSVIAVAMISLFSVFNENDDALHGSIPYSTFVAQVESGQVQEVSIQDRVVTVQPKTGPSYRTIAPKDADFTTRLLEKGVTVTAMPPEERPLLLSLLISSLPLLIFFAIWMYFARQMQGGAGRAMTFGRSTARLQDKNQTGRGGRSPLESPKIHASWRTHPQRRPARRPSGNGQDAPGPCCRRRGGRPLFFHFRF